MSKTITDVYKQTKRTRQAVKAEVKDTNATHQKTTYSRSDEELLRNFDLALEYGPCLGITRLERWQRAHKHGLNPPLEVKEIIDQLSSNSAVLESVWNDYNI